MEKTVRYLAFFVIGVAAFSCGKPLEKLPAEAFQTVCNPVNLSYRFQPEAIAGRVNGRVPSYREGADPTVVLFGDRYYAFVSHSGGYFSSADLIHWELVVANDVFPVEAYAPTAVVIGDAVYVVASGVGRVIRSTAPDSGQWAVVNPAFPLTFTDPALFLDDDGRLYYYAGCSDSTPIYGYELSPKTFEPLSEQHILIAADKLQRGWEVKSDYNIPAEGDNPWIEGAWMNKHNGKYYLQYAAPGTEMKSYCDGVFVADAPLGPFTLAEHNPFAYKPGGFVCGAGHGSTFLDRFGNCWHVGTATISQRHMFERRLSLFPAFFDADGVLHARTVFGDYPMIIPDHKIAAPDELFPAWMLLSFGKKVTVSSEMARNEASKLCDEDIRTWWSAETGHVDEWLQLDLEEAAAIYALQLNFADEGAALYGRADSIFYQYTVEASADGKHWELLLDRSDNTVDAPHDYVQLSQPIKARYLKVRNRYVPSGRFSVSEFRVFGKSDMAAPTAVDNVRITREADRRSVRLKWIAVPSATGYVVRFGYSADKLYSSYMVYARNELDIHSLNAALPCFFAVDAFNAGGITCGAVSKEEE
ncbi:MAG: family 43 glycosylhydrolase [Bacteroidales bacterium]|jgi:hypothetical protein|nr:family 43 glycosylhydrolase [Bacteroidales bacterium]